MWKRCSTIALTVCERSRDKSRRFPTFHLHQHSLFSGNLPPSGKEGGSSEFETCSRGEYHSLCHTTIYNNLQSPSLIIKYSNQWGRFREVRILLEVEQQNATWWISTRLHLSLQYHLFLPSFLWFSSKILPFKESLPHDSNRGRITFLPDHVHCLHRFIFSKRNNIGEWMFHFSWSRCIWNMAALYC